jgi:predicted HD phosphohydrolase
MANMTNSMRAMCLDDVLAILRNDDSFSGEGALQMSVLDHHLQCAAVLRDEYPDDYELQIAGLLHDIGHHLVPDQVDRHGEVGGAYVRDLFGERVSGLIELHVDAKRYLVSVEPDYREQLSPGSEETLIAQGGVMTDEEIARFEASPFSADAISLRRADERAKVPGREVAPLEEWIALLESMVAVTQ